MPTPRIIAAIDLCPASAMVSQQASILARQRSVRLTLVNVVTPGVAAEYGEDPWLLARRKGVLRRLLPAASVEADTQILMGDAGSKLRGAAHASDVCMLVIGRGEDRFYGPALGRTARHLLRHVRVPTLVVPPLAPDDTPWSLPDVERVAAVSDRDRAGELCLWATKVLARGLGAEATGVSAAARSTRLRPGEARTLAETLVRAAMDLDAQIISVPVHGRLGDLRAPLGDITEELLIQSPVPVLVYPVRYLIRIYRQPGGEDLAA